MDGREHGDFAPAGQLAPSFTAPYASHMSRELPGRLLGAALLLGCALPLVACAGRASGDRELSGLREELAKVQAEHEALERRVANLEHHDDDAHPLDAEASGDGSANTVHVGGGLGSDAKPLKVVKLEPGGDAPPTKKVVLTPPPEDDDDSPRPLLKIGPDGVEESYPDEPLAGQKSKKSKSPSLDPKAGAEYDAALKLAKGKKWKAALDAFAGFVVRYPDHPYAANALYWRGECYYSLAQYGAAADQFDGLLASYPASSKVPDALLKLGLTQKKLGSDAKAKAAFARLRNDYPNSEAAKKIPPEGAS